MSNQKEESRDKKISDRELISGRIYSRNPINSDLEEKAEYLLETLTHYKQNRNNEIEILEPYSSITLDKTANTIIRPMLAVRNKDSKSQIDWIIDYAQNSNDILAFCIKPVVFKDAGIKEYWILDLEDKVIIIYNLEKDGFVQQVIANPRRVKVGIFNVLFNYSDLFREDW